MRRVLDPGCAFERMCGNPLTREWLLDLGAGAQFPAHLVKYARCLVSMGLADTAIKEFASLGSSSYTNCERDLHRRLAGFVNVSPFWIPITVYERGSWRHVTKWLPTLAPYELFSAMFDRGSKNFELTCVGPDGEDGITSYWDNARRSDWGKSHPVNACPTLSAYRHRTVPTLWHADGIEVYSGIPEQ